MTKKEKEVLDLILEEVSGIRKLMAAMAGTTALIEAGDDTVPLQIEEAELAPIPEDQITTTADEVVDAMNAEHMTVDPITDDERAAYNNWLIDCAKFMGDRGESIKLILQTAGVTGMSQVNDRSLLETITNEVNRVMAEKSNA